MQFQITRDAYLNLSVKQSALCAGGSIGVVGSDMYRGGKHFEYLKHLGSQKNGKPNRCSKPLNMCSDTDLSGAGCGSSASPVLRRGRLERSDRSTHVCLARVKARR